MMVARVLIADDHAMLRQGLASLLEQHYEVVGQAKNGHEACTLYEKLNPSLLILDLDMPGLSGLATLKRIIQRDQNARVMILSMHNDCVYVSRAIQAGAKGFITKTDSPEIILDCIQRILKGERYINNELALNLSLYNLEQGSNPIENLSPKEFDVFRRLVDGESVNNIAKELHISYKTVANIQTTVKQKLGAKTAGQLIHIATRFNILKPTNI